MMKIPIGCRARYDFIHEQAWQLCKQFKDGNKAHVRSTLAEMPSSVAQAVVALMATEVPELAAYLVEVA